MTDAELDEIVAALTGLAMGGGEAIWGAATDAIENLRRDLTSALAAQATTQDALDRLSARHAVVLQDLSDARAALVIAHYTSGVVEHEEGK